MIQMIQERVTVWVEFLDELCENNYWLVTAVIYCYNCCCVLCKYIEGPPKTEIPCMRKHTSPIKTILILKLSICYICLLT